jgi:hypothetical protein
VKYTDVQLIVPSCYTDLSNVRVQNGWRLFENRVLRRIFGTKRELSGGRMERTA